MTPTDLRPVLADRPLEQLFAAFELDRQWDALANGAYDDRPDDRLDALLHAALATRRASRCGVTWPQTTG